MSTQHTPKRSCYNFNFVGGGWNQIHATSKDEAIQLAMAKYADDDICTPDPDTFRLETQEDTDALMSMFY